MELRLSGRTITPGLEALAGATVNATARTIIVDLVSLSGSTSAADGVPLDAAGGNGRAALGGGLSLLLGALACLENRRRLRR